jgi:hypothetical protein
MSALRGIVSSVRQGISETLNDRKRSGNYDYRGDVRGDDFTARPDAVRASALDRGQSLRILLAAG